MVSPLFSIVVVLLLAAASVFLIQRKAKAHMFRYALTMGMIVGLVLIPVYILLFFQGFTETADMIRAWVTLLVTAVLLISTCFFSYRHYFMG